ncbi:MAG: hypothetical protein WCS73_07090 [Lentisphaeria bacterium]
MKFFYIFIFSVMLGSFIEAADFTWSFLETPSLKNSINPKIALFDGAVNFNTNRVIWECEAASNGCGVLVELNAGIVLSRVEVYTAKPNQLKMAPLKTEFVVWNDGKGNWDKAISISDVTGRAAEKEYTSATINTTWDAPSKPIRVLKILMYGSGIWLTEIKLFAKDETGKEYLLKSPEAVSLSDEGTILKPGSFGGGASVNIKFWSPKQNYVGNPNALSRRDRVVFHFDLSSYIEEGKIKEAVLALPLQPFGVLTGNDIELQCFKTEHSPIFNMDFISNDVFSVVNLFVDKKTEIMHFIDVTKMVNAALNRGDGTIAFRVRNGTIEKFGNRQNKPEGVIVDSQKLKLEIVR